MIRAVTIAAFLALVVTTAASANAEPTSYTLRCRGGEGMTMQYFSTGLAFSLRFAIAHAPSTDAQALAPGQCTWLDRPLNPDEPTTLSIRHGKRANTTIDAIGGADPTGGFRASTDLVSEREKIKDVNALTQSIRDSAHFTVEAYSQDGALVVTKVHR
jgi:hypothetical protein